MEPQLALTSEVLWNLFHEQRVWVTTETDATGVLGTFRVTPSMEGRPSMRLILASTRSQVGQPPTIHVQGMPSDLPVTQTMFDRIRRRAQDPALGLDLKGIDLAEGT